MDKIKSLNNTNAKLIEENAELKTELKKMADKVNNIEQEALNNNIEIMGVPVTPNENCLEIVNAVGKILEVNSEDITSASRAKSSKNLSTNNNVVVRLNNPNQKHFWIKQFRNRKVVLASDLHKSLPRTKIYVNEHLTSKNKKILYLTKQKAKDLYKYVWVKNGEIFIRKDDASKILKVSSVDEISKIM